MRVQSKFASHGEIYLEFLNLCNYILSRLKFPMFGIWHGVLLLFVEKIDILIIHLSYIR